MSPEVNARYTPTMRLLLERMARAPYPPLHTLSARAAKEAIFGLRKTAPRAEIVEIIERHASRADRRFINDRMALKAPKAQGQLSFDL